MPQTKTIYIVIHIYLYIHFPVHSRHHTTTTFAFLAVSFQILRSSIQILSCLKYFSIYSGRWSWGVKKSFLIYLPNICFIVLFRMKEYENGVYNRHLELCISICIFCFSLFLQPWTTESLLSHENVKNPLFFKKGYILVH